MNEPTGETPAPRPLFHDAHTRSCVKTITAGVLMHGLMHAPTESYGYGNPHDSTLVTRSFDLAEKFIARAEYLHSVATRPVEPSAETAP